MTKFPYFAGRKNIRKPEAASGIFRSTKDPKVYTQELGTYSYVKLVEHFPSALSWGRLCDELGCSYSWQPGENSQETKGTKTITCCTDNFVPLVAVTKQKQLLHFGIVSNRARPLHKENLCQGKKCRRPCLNCWNYSQKN